MIVLVFGFSHMDIKRGGGYQCGCSLVTYLSAWEGCCTCMSVLIVYVTRIGRNVYACSMSHRAEMGDLDRGVIPE